MKTRCQRCAIAPVVSLLVIAYIAILPNASAANDREAAYSYRYRGNLVVLTPSPRLLAPFDAAPQLQQFAAASKLERDPLSEHDALRNTGLSLYRLPQSKPSAPGAPHASTLQALEAGVPAQPVFPDGDYLLIPHDEVIIAFDDEKAVDEAKAYLETLGGEAVADMRYLRPRTFIARIFEPAFGRAFAVSREYATLPGIRFAEPNFILVPWQASLVPKLEPEQLDKNLLLSALKGVPSPQIRMPAGSGSITRPSWTTLLDEGFESNITTWTTLKLGASADALPLLQSNRRYGGSRALYLTGAGTQGRLPPGPYPNSVDTLTLFSSMNLQGYEEAYIEAWFYAKYEDPDSITPRLYDYGSIGIVDLSAGLYFSTPLAVLFTGDLTADSSTINGWRRALFRIPRPYLKDNVSVGIRFLSDSTAAAEGLYVDDLAVLATTNVDTEPVANDTYAARQYELKNVGQIADSGNDSTDMNVPEAWSVVSVSDDVVVAVVDSGVELAHPDLNLVTGYDANTGAVGGEPRDGSMHGTGCAGNVGAIGGNVVGTVGVAPGVQIMPVFMGFELSHLASAIDLAVEHGASVLTNSWGFSQAPSAAIANAVEDALAAGRTVLFAAGNGPDRPPWTYNTVFPCNLTASTDVICVGASSPTDEYKGAASSDGEFRWGSSYIGAGPDVVAPSSWSYTTDLLGAAGANADAAFTGIDTAYTHDFSGTSSSTPKVAGVAALMLSKNPDLTPAQVKNILRSTAKDIGSPGVDDRTGAGRVDAFAAVIAVPPPQGAQNLDIDGNGAATPLTDGLLIIRRLFGFDGAALVDGAVAPSCGRCDAMQIVAHLGGMAEVLDVDGNGATEALTDGLLTIRHLFGFTGSTLTGGAVAADCSRCTAAAITGYLNGLMP